MTIYKYLILIDGIFILSISNIMTLNPIAIISSGITIIVYAFFEHKVLEYRNTESKKIE